MTIMFTDEEKKWIKTDLSKEYTLLCMDNAPEEIRESINKKIKEHKEWLEQTFGAINHKDV